MIIKKKKKKMTIDVIYFNKKNFNNKRKRIKKVLFNVFISEKNDYFNVNIIFINKLNFNIYIFLNNYNILDIIDKQIINLIIIEIDLNRNLMAINFINFYIRVIMNFNYFHHFFIDYLIFIIYEKTYLHFIKDIKEIKYNFSNIILLISIILFKINALL